VSRAAALFAIAAAAVLGVRSAFLAPLNHNVAWLLHAALRWLDGARLYVDLVETNPPLIVWSNAAAVRAAGALGIAPVPAVRLMTFVLAAGSALVSGLLLHRATASRFVAVVPALVLLALPGAQFGEREHLLVALALPYVIASACPGLVSRRIMIALGVAGAAGIALKPYFAGVFVAAELVRWRMSRRVFGAGTIAVLGFGAAYLAAIVLTTPAYLEFARKLLPFYPHYRGQPLWLMPLAPGVPATILAAVGWTAGVRRGFAPLRLAAYLAGAGLLAGAIVQRKAFPYHAVPAVSFALLGLALTVAGRVDAHRLRARILAGWLAVLGGTAAIEFTLNQNADDIRALTAILQRYGGQTVATFSTTLSPTWPSVLDAGVRWTLPAASLWGPVAGHALQPDGGSYRPRDAMPERERWLLDITVAALVRDPPEAIIVDRQAATPHGRLDAVRYLGAHPDFPALWRAYVLVDRAGRFTVYERRPVPAH